MFVLVETQYFGFHFLTHFQYFAWVFHTAPSQVGDVQQAVDTAQIHKRTVIGDVFHDTFNQCAFLQVFHQGFAFFAQSGFQNGAAGYHDIVAFAVEFDHFELNFFAFEV